MDLRAKLLKNRDEMTKKQTRTFTIWCNTILKHYGEPIKDISKDFKDGMLLHMMITHLAKLERKKIKKGNNKFECLILLNDIFKILKQENVKIVNISSEDIYDCNLKLILGLIWTLIQHYQIKSLKRLASIDSEKASTEDIIKASVGKLLNMESKDIKINEDFKSGILLCQMVNQKVPNAILNLDQLKPENALENVQTAFDKAEAHLNVPQMIEASDVVESKFDKNSFLTYLSTILVAQGIEVELVQSDEILQQKKTEIPDEIIQEASIKEPVKFSETKSLSFAEKISKDEQPKKQFSQQKEKLEDSLVEKSVEQPQEKKADTPKEKEILIDVIKFSDIKEIKKTPNSYLLLNFNGQKDYNTKDVKFILESKDKSKVTTSTKFEVSFKSCNIAQAELKNVSEGVYRGILTGNPGVNYVVKQDIIISKSYKNQIKTYYHQKEFYETSAIQILIDISDFEFSDFEVKGIDYGEHWVILSCVKSFQIFSFLPSVLQQYKISFYINKKHIEESDLIFDIKETKKSHFPYSDKTYKYYVGIPSEISVDVPEKRDKMSIFGYETLVKDEKIESKFIDNDSEEYQVSAEINLKKNKIQMWEFPQTEGNYFIITQITSKDGLVYFLEPIFISIHKNKFIEGIPTKIFLKKDLKIESIESYQDGNFIKIPHKTKIVTRASEKYQKIKMVPLGNCKLTLHAVDKNKKKYEYDLGIVEEITDRHSLNQKYIKKISLPSRNYRIEHLKIKLLDDCFCNQNFDSKIEDDELIIKFVPTKTGCFNLKIYDLTGKKLLCDDFIVFDAKNNFVDEKENSFVVKMKKQFDCLKLLLFDTVSKESKHVPFVIKESRKYKCQKIVPEMHVDVPGNYIFIVKDKDDNIVKFENVKCLRAPENKLIVNMPSIVEIPLKDFTDKKLPEECVSIMKKISSKKPEKIKIPSKILIDEENEMAKIKFIPEHEGIFVMNIAVDHKKFLKELKEIEVISEEKYVKIYGKLPDTKEHQIQTLQIAKLSELDSLSDYDLKNYSIELIKDDQVISTSELIVDNKTIGLDIPPVKDPEKYTVRLKSTVDDFFLETNLKQLFEKRTHVEDEISEKERKNKDDEEKIYDIEDSEKFYDVEDSEKSQRIEIKLDLKKEQDFEEKTKSVKLFVSNPKFVSDKDSGISILDSKKQTVPINVVEVDKKTSKVEFEAKISEIYKINAETVEKGSDDVFVFEHPKISYFENYVSVDEEEKATLYIKDIKKLEEKFGKSYKIVCLRDGNRADVPVNLISENEKTIDITFIPKDLSTYEFYAISNKDGSVLASTKLPLVAVVKTKTIFGKIFVKGEGIKFAEFQKDNRFDIISETPFSIKNVFVQSDKFQIEFKKFQKTPKCITVMYNPNFMGKFSIFIRVGGIFLKDCPIYLDVYQYGKAVVENDMISNLTEINFWLDKDMKKQLQDLDYKVSDENGIVVPSQLTVPYFDKDKNLSEMKVNFIAHHPGLHSLKIKNHQDEAFDEVDLKIFVEPWETDKNKVKIIGKIDDYVKEGEFLKIFMSTDREYQEDDIIVKIQGPVSEICETVKAGKNVVLTMWKAEKLGDYHLSITIIGEKVVYGYQKSIKVVSKDELENIESAKFYVCGNGIYSAITAFPNIFQVYSEVYRTENVEVDISSQEKVELEKYTKNLDGKSTTTFVYCTHQEGEYMINIKYKGNHICNSPFFVHANKKSSLVLPISCSLAKKSRGRINKIFEFTIDATRSLDSWIFIDINCSEFKHKIKPKIKELKDGIYSVAFKTPYKKTYFVKITNRGFEIAGSPFKIEFR